MKEKNGASEMEIYIVDAVAFLAYLADTLPKMADDIFRKAERKKIKLLTYFSKRAPPTHICNDYNMILNTSYL